MKKIRERKRAGRNKQEIKKTNTEGDCWFACRWTYRNKDKTIEKKLYIYINNRKLQHHTSQGNIKVDDTKWQNAYWRIDRYRGERCKTMLHV